MRLYYGQPGLHYPNDEYSMAHLQNIAWKARRGKTCTTGIIDHNLKPLSIARSTRNYLTIRSTPMKGIHKVIRTSKPEFTGGSVQGATL